MADRTSDVAMSKHIRLRDVGGQQDPFCIYPFKHLEATREGRLDFCCKFEQLPTTDDGTPGTLARHSLEEMWNSSQMRAIRQNIVEGRLVRGCEGCYEREAAGDQSDRTQGNEMWRGGWLNGGGLSLEQFKAGAVANGFRVSGPEYVELRMGNLCNLKCRICYGDTSSAIAADSVHSQWAGTYTYGAADRWWLDPSMLRKIFQQAEQVRQLYLLGGEPFLIKEIGNVLQYLINRGVAEQIVLEFATNGTVVPPWLDLTAPFKKVRINFSIDGYGALNRYLRYPCDWDTLVRNIAYLRTLSNAEVAYSTVVQAYNALSLTDLFSFCDSIELPPGSVYPLVHPEHLSVRVLPEAARLVAAERMREYAARCPREYRTFMEGLANGLARPVHGENDDDMRLLFMLFTSELDTSRGERFREACPELYDFMLQAGVVDRLESQVRVPELPLQLAFGDRRSRAWMRSGWWRDEETAGARFVWSAGDHSFLRVGLPTADDVHVSLDCAPFVFPGCPQQAVSVLLNGRAIERIVLQPRRRSYSLVLPKALLSCEGNTLEFRYAYSREPRTVLSDSNDSRELAVCWYSVRFATLFSECSARPQSTP
jgi:sulfatase maturation enzyme AslB (radical SAM superfamily)